MGPRPRSCGQPRRTLVPPGKPPTALGGPLFPGMTGIQPCNVCAARQPRPDALGLPGAGARHGPHPRTQEHARRHPQNSRQRQGRQPGPHLRGAGHGRGRHGTSQGARPPDQGPPARHRRHVVWARPVLRRQPRGLRPVLRVRQVQSSPRPPPRQAPPWSCPATAWWATDAASSPPRLASTFTTGRPTSAGSRWRINAARRRCQSAVLGEILAASAISSAANRCPSDTLSRPGRAQTTTDSPGGFVGNCMTTGSVC